jgi:hypothetical protein
LISLIHIQEEIISGHSNITKTNWNKKIQIC